MLLLLPEVGERLEWPGVQADSGSLVLAHLQPPASPGTLSSIALTAKVRALLLLTGSFVAVTPPPLTLSLLPARACSAKCNILPGTPWFCVRMRPLPQATISLTCTYSGAHCCSISTWAQGWGCGGGAVPHTPAGA